MKKPRRQQPEEALHMKVVTFLEQALPPNVLWWHTPNGGKRGKREAGRFKAMGVKAGIPDLLFLYRGELFGIELKAPPKPLKNGAPSKNRPRCSPEQDAMHVRMFECGAKNVSICWSLEGVEETLRRNLFPLKATTLAR